MVRKLKFYDSNINSDFDIEFLQKEVGKLFPFYDFIFGNNNLVFYCRINQDSLESDFNDLREILSKKNYIPILRHEKGEDLIYIIKKPLKKEKTVWINIILIIIYLN